MDNTDLIEDFAKLEEAANKGCAIAQLKLGKEYRALMKTCYASKARGREMERLFKMAIDQGCVKSAERLAAAYFHCHKRSFPSDYVKAYDLFLWAAERGSAASMHYLGELNSKRKYGRGINRKLEFDWHYLAAKNGLKGSIPYIRSLLHYEKVEKALSNDELRTARALIEFYEDYQEEQRRERDNFDNPLLKDPPFESDSKPTPKIVRTETLH